MNKRERKQFRKLLSLSKYGKIKEIKEIFENMDKNKIHLMLSSADEEGNTLLHKAASGGQATTIEFLLGFGSISNDRKKYARTPLHEAAIFGNLESVKVLIRHGALVDCHSTRGRTPLMYACRGGFEKLVEFLLCCGSNVNERNENGITSLYIASREGHLEILRVLLKHGADVKLSTKTKHTPLHVAVSNSHIQIVNALLDEGANATAIDTNGISIWHEAAGAGFVPMLDLFLERQIPLTTDNDKILARNPLHYASVEGNHQFVQALLDKNIFAVDLQDDDGCTALYYAAANGQYEVVSVLLNGGSNPNICSIRRSPLHCAVEWNRAACVRLLVNAGARIDKRDMNGKSPVHIAVEKGLSDILAILNSKMVS